VASKNFVGRAPKIV